MIFAHDENIFAFSSYTPTEQWVAPLGQRTPRPKTEGMSLLLYAFVSRERGNGVMVSRIQLEESKEAHQVQN
jgi:hypothetical protein